MGWSYCVVVCVQYIVCVPWCHRYDRVVASCGIEDAPCGPGLFTFTAPDSGGEFYFACARKSGAHCSQGNMRANITVRADCPGPQVFTSAYWRAVL